MASTRAQSKIADVDARGLSCPEPLWLAKTALDKLTSGTLTVLVDDPTSVINVTRYAEQHGFTVEPDEDAGAYRLRIRKA